MILVALKNVANGEIVDVRYFKIAWTPELKNTDLGNLNNFSDKFACGGSYEKTIGTDIMNDKIYTVAVANGIAKEEFHALFALDGQVYAKLEDAKAGTTASTKLGTIEEVPAVGSTTTYNLDWKFDINNNPITLAEYNAGTAVRTVYGRYYRKTNKAETFIFNITLTLSIDKMAFIAGYQQPYWNEGTLSNTNKDKVLQVNPALTSDATYGIANYYDCQIIADMLKGYNKASSTIGNPSELVSNATGAEFVFDANRISMLPGTVWSVSADGKDLKKNNVVAATIDGKVIRLYESTLPTATTHGIATEAAQELLGKNVPVKLVATHCTGFKIELDHFLVNFINPLTMTLADVKGSFEDLLTGGSTINVEKIATIKETFGLKRTVWANGAEVTPKLVQWYDVKGVTWNLDKATTNLKKEGDNITISPDVAASDWSDFANDYVLTASPDNTGATSLTFQNNSGTHIQQSFKIAIPVYVQTKWAPYLADPTKQIVVLTVNPGATN